MKIKIRHCQTLSVAADFVIIRIIILYRRRKDNIAVNMVGIPDIDAINILEIIEKPV